MGVERARKRVPIFQRQNKDTKSRDGSLQELGLEPGPPPPLPPHLYQILDFSLLCKLPPRTTFQGGENRNYSAVGYPGAWADP